MSERIHALAQHLFGKATIEECSLEEVKTLVQRFPYFAPAQFLLLDKLKQEDEEAYSLQLQKSILYHPNPLEFQYLISSDRFHTEVSFEEEKQFTPDDISEPVVGVEEVQVAEEAEPFVGISEEPAEAVLETTVNQPPQEPVMEQPQAFPQAAQPTSEPQPESSRHITGLALQNPELEKAGLTFEPFHTVDYFASQGIKLSQEEMPKDKFGKQLRSFTDWLKTMKRLSPAERSSATDPGFENKVQHLADDSIHQSDVWTEAMAEVWTKQGNTQKAIETYNKLSLLNPSKRAYFATKIENLKRS